MKNPIDYYWQKRLAGLKNVLEANNFEVFIADSASHAKEIALNQIIPATGAKSISRGGSMTVESTGLFESIKNNPDFDYLETSGPDLSKEEKLERRRQSLLVDLFITGTNAVTEEGQLVNLDMIGNRIGGITFGPKIVLIFIGRNKIVPDLEAAMDRIKNYASPTNAMRLDMKTPCAKTSQCEECTSRERICNTWTITEKSFPKGRVKIILINEDLGL